ncbi:MAG: TerC family protein, partial [Armatimonadetes bacterium]|nr:TerC family protein [Armatimonadota bacterium]
PPQPPTPPARRAPRPRPHPPPPPPAPAPPPPRAPPPGYLLEKSHTVDNIVLFVLLCTYFRVPPQFQHRVLFWGVVGALIMRGALILIGAVLLARFHWILYLFGAFLVLTGIKLFVMKGKEMDPGKNPMVKLLKRLMPFTPDYHGSKFFVRKEGLLVATPLFLVLILVETTDLIFALDSIPAIFGITRDPFIVFSSNVFAILGLRSLYFLLAGVMNRFHYLHYGLALVLIFIGTKMMIADLYKIPVGISLGVIALILGTSVAASLMKPVPEGKEGDQLSEEGEIPEPQPAAGALH